MVPASERLIGHALVRVDEVERQLAAQSLAVQNAQVKTEATRVDTLEQSTTAKFGDTEALVQSLAAVQADVAKLKAANEIIGALQTQVTTLQARVAELECRPKLAKAAGYSLQEAKAAGYSLQKAKVEGYSLQDAMAVGYSLQEARKAGYSLQEAMAVGYSLQAFL